VRARLFVDDEFSLSWARLGLSKTGAGLGWELRLVSVKTAVFRFLTEITEIHMVSNFANLNLTEKLKKLNFGYS
jgi:hypothetical protein